jgi:prepilin-type N-terminal cleavage/methylation domain-containing protein
MTGSPGLTLIELLTALSLLSIVLIMCTALFISSLWSYKREDRRSQAAQDAMYALQQIEREVRMGRLFPGSIDPYDKSSLKIKSMRDNVDYIIIETGRSNGRKVLNRVAVKPDGGRTANKIIENIESIMFNYDDNDCTISVSLVTCSQGADAGFSVSTKLCCRID